jgi:hypothetical protein
LRGGGASTYALGIFLDFFIAMSVATIYYVASRRLKFLAEHWIVCGLFYGAAVDQVMTLIVLPLSALHAAGPYKLLNPSTLNFRTLSLTTRYMSRLWSLPVTAPFQ